MKLVKMGDKEVPRFYKEGIEKFMEETGFDKAHIDEIRSLPHAIEYVTH